jgi:hypothetical protein
MRDEAEATVAEQLAAMQRQNQALAKRVRRLSQAMAGLALVGLLMISTGAYHAPETPKTIEAERFVLRDAAGKVRMEIAVREDGSAGMHIFNPEGRKRVGLSVMKEGAAGLGLSDENGEQLVALDLIEEEGARLGLRDATHRNNIVLRSMPTDDAFIGILGPKEEILTYMGTSPEGRSAVTVRNRDQTGTCRLAVNTNGSQELSLLHGLDQPRYSLSSTDDHGAGFRFWDSNHKVSIEMGTADHHPAVLRMSHKGKPRIVMGMPDEDHVGLVVFGSKFPQMMNFTYEPDDKPSWGIHGEDGVLELPEMPWPHDD